MSCPSFTFISLAESQTSGSDQLSSIQSQNIEKLSTCDIDVMTLDNKRALMSSFVNKNRSTGSRSTWGFLDSRPPWRPEEVPFVAPNKRYVVNGKTVAVHNSGTLARVIKAYYRHIDCLEEEEIVIQQNHPMTDHFSEL
ncbi:uncharacterized protein [Watersipora subatra]|uniref:uncharacterized protein n=1 Tax=Watersipora subatra TaxID=2589382 RepID=UPI00355AE3FF